MKRILSATMGTLLLVCTSCTATKSENSTSTAAPPTIHAFGSIEHASIIDAAPGTALKLRDATGQDIREGTVDALGSLVFHDITPGDGYVVVGESETSAPFRILDRNDPPPTDLYNSTKLNAGLNYVPMRDGVEIAATVRLPAGKTINDGPFPTLIEYSGYQTAAPHDLLESAAARIGNPDAPEDPLAPATGAAVSAIITPQLGWAAVSVQIRGSGCSGGTFDLFGMPTIYDGYDIVETIARQPWVKGNKVAMAGISYSAISQMFVGGTQPPSLAALAMVSMTDDLYDGIGSPGGIFNTGFAKGWLSERQEDAKPAPEGGQPWAKELVKQGDPKCTANQKLHGQALNVLEILSAEPFRNPVLYKDRTPGEWAKKIKVPTLIIGGTQDEQLGSHWATILPQLTTDNLRVVLYNGNHNDGISAPIFTEWYEFLSIYLAQEVPRIADAFMGISSLFYSEYAKAPTPALEQSEYSGRTDFSAVKAEFESKPRVRVLLDVGAGPNGPGSFGGAAERTYDSWPPQSAKARRWFFGANGSLSPTAPTTSSTVDYMADPTKRPMMTLPKGSVNDAQPQWVYQPVPNGTGVGFITAPIQSDFSIAGWGSVDLTIDASAADTDLQVGLTEVTPDGNELYLGSGWLRASHRKLNTEVSDELRAQPTHLAQDAQPLTPGEATAVRVAFNPLHAQIRAGSRLRLVISAPGGDRPLWDFKTIETGTTKVRVHLGPSLSSIVLPVIDEPSKNPRPTCGVLRGQPCRRYQALSNGG